MSAAPKELLVAKCATCHFRFLGSELACPRCAAPYPETMRVPALGTVLASTEVVYPADGWPAPHRLVLVEVAEAVRLLAVADAPLPAPGSIVALEAGPAYYRARAEPSAG